MTFDEYINNKFLGNLELAREEIALRDDVDDTECLAWRYATDWTQEEIASEIGRALGNRWAKRQDDINKAFYE